MLKISEDFSDAPGARFEADGPDSGEEFFKRLLKPRFEEAARQDRLLLVDLDDTFGYASSFLSEAFSSLEEEFGVENVKARVRIKSDDDPDLIDFVNEIIEGN